MATDDLTRLNELFDGLIQQLSTAARKQLSRDIARRLRATQAQRIKQNTAPDGSAFEARKPQPAWAKRIGAIKRKLMFQKIIRQKYLKPEYSSQAASVGFTGFISRIATEHQYGLRGRINERISIRYPQRELLGVTQNEMNMIEAVVIRHLATK
ncbi:phage virion morphogenesis protein [Shewanella xiamenensis]|uniref:phage virion morphogenesis protein n=1 Tax=Shewanella xiamenensis TaxID=332186 RepID=UPI0021C06B87|nr:phage virion morphogenesis protein [Shewanella xiamenensis]MCT8866923.1 phage virion morphogenesis protein [Shewanella xiamenensis]